MNTQNLWHIHGIEHPMKGRKAWNKSMKIDKSKYPTMGHYKKHTAESIEKMKTNHPHLRDHQIGTWKGDKVKYRALHNWVEVRLGKPRGCKMCNRNDLKGLKAYHWANISGEYKRDLSDWMRLCASCHKRFDIGRNWSIYKSFFEEVIKISND